MQGKLDPAFESARFPLDSTKSRCFLSRPPGCIRGGSTVPQCHYPDQGKWLSQLRKLLFPAPKEKPPTASRSLKHTPGHPAITKVQSPSPIASRVSSCGF
jgi:hypothetical protein